MSRQRTGASGHDGAAPSTAARPAVDAARQGRLRDWWSACCTRHIPPGTLAYVVIGATLAPRVKLVPLLAALIAFFLAVGVAAHALDEYHGRPLRTQIPGGVLIVAATVGLQVH